MLPDVVSRNNVALLYCALFFVRRIVFCYLVLYLNYVTFITLHFEALCSLASLCVLLKFRPFESKIKLAAEVINETTVYLLMLTMCLFTLYVEDPKTRFNIGYAYIAISSLNVTFHLLNMIVSGILKAIGQCKKNYLKRKL